MSFTLFDDDDDDDDDDMCEIFSKYITSKVNYSILRSGKIIR